jgi:REP element-mobilizing transposase RayT
MARPLRFQYPGAIYHVMARGDGGKQVFETPADHQVFLARLGETCVSHGWRVHAWVLMGNHFHLLVETPQPNLVGGMKWLLGTFSQGWNKARQRRGHVFQGRYKSVPVGGAERDAHYFRSVADYIHLNPARAGLAGGGKGRLLDYPWSSLPSHATGEGPEWLVLERVLAAFELAQDDRGRQAYVDWLEARAANQEGKIDETAMAALRRGWYLGDETFRTQLLCLLDQVGSAKPRARRAPDGGGRDHGERDAERLLVEGSAALKLPADSAGLADIRKGDPRKAVLAALIRRHTGVGTDWLAARLQMGHPGSVSRLLGVVRKQPKLLHDLEKLEKMLISGD